MADSGIGLGADVVVNGVNYGTAASSAAPRPGSWSSPVTAGKAQGAGSTSLTVTLWIVLAIEIALLVLARRAMRRHHGG